MAFDEENFAAASFFSAIVGAAIAVFSLHWAVGVGFVLLFGGMTIWHLTAKKIKGRRQRRAEEEQERRWRLEREAAERWEDHHRRQREQEPIPEESIWSNDVGE
jgi:hypothetical protein